jgi:hypothetical protein
MVKLTAHQEPQGISSIAWRHQRWNTMAWGHADWARIALGNTWPQPWTLSFSMVNLTAHQEPQGISNGAWRYQRWNTLAVDMLTEQELPWVKLGPWTLSFSTCEGWLHTQSPRGSSRQQPGGSSCSTTGYGPALIKKERKFSSYTYKKIQMGSVAKSYMR